MVIRSGVVAKVRVWVVDLGTIWARSWVGRQANVRPADTLRGMPRYQPTDHHEIMMSGSSQTCSRPLCNWPSLRRSRRCAYHEPTATAAEVAELDRYAESQRPARSYRSRRRW